MKLLLTGVLPWSVWSIARRLAQGGHEVTIVGLTEDSRGGGSGVRHVKLAPGEKETTRYITAVNRTQMGRGDPARGRRRMADPPG